jgi:predicted KAP-like P-loop ATPase
LVVALYGAWGSGKSSVKNMVVEALKESGTQDVVLAQFNSWQFANRERLTAAFFDEIGIALGRGTVGSAADRARLVRRWRSYATYLQATSGLVGLATRPATLGAALVAVFLFGAAATQAWWLATILGLVTLVVVTILKYSSRAAAKVAALLEAGLEAGRKPLEEAKRELAESLRKLGAPVLVVIDDVDRLTPQETQELLQLVKANADFPNLVYLLLCDRETVAKSIERVLEVNGREYLEKIVQVGFDLPVISRGQIDRVLFAGLDEVLEQYGEIRRRFDQHRWANLYLGGLQPYFKTLRDVNRYVSTFAFHAALFRREGSFEVNPVDLIGLEVLRVFEPEVYRALPQHKELLTGQGDADGKGQEERKRALAGIVERAPGERRERVQEIIRQLFPSAEWAFGGMRYGAGFADEWVRELRVCSPHVFDRYFRSAIPEGDISQAVIDRLMALVADRAGLRAEFKSLASQGLLAVTMERLEAYKEKLPLEHARSIVTAVLDIGEDLPEGRPGLLSFEPAMHACRIIYWRA